MPGPGFKFEKRVVRELFRWLGLLSTFRFVGQTGAGRSFAAPACEGFELIYQTEGQNPGVVFIARDPPRGGIEDSSTAKCVEQLTQGKPSRIYIERVAAGKKTSCATHGLKEKPGQECMGLDSLEGIETRGDVDTFVKLRFPGKIKDLESIQTEKQLSDEAFNAYLEKLVVTNKSAAKTREEYRKMQKDKNMSDEAFDVFLSNYLTQEKYANVKYILSYKQADLAEWANAAQWLLEQRKSGNDYQAKLTTVSLDSSAVRGDLEIVKSGELQRVTSLLDTVAHNPQGLFAIALVSEANLVPNEVSIPGTSRCVQDTGAAGYALLKLRQVEDTTPFAILAKRR